jgi:hypothetical protein
MRVRPLSIIVTTGLCLAGLLLGPPSLRVALTVVLIMVLPGAAVTDAVFARETDPAERLLSTLGLSFAIVVLGGLLLDATVGISRGSVAYFLAGVSILAALAGMSARLARGSGVSKERRRARRRNVTPLIDHYRWARSNRRSASRWYSIRVAFYFRFGWTWHLPRGSQLRRSDGTLRGDGSIVERPDPDRPSSPWARAPAQARLGVSARDIVIFAIAATMVGAAIAYARTPLTAHGVRGYSVLWMTPKDPVLELGVESQELRRAEYRLVASNSAGRIGEWRINLAPGGTWGTVIPSPFGGGTVKAVLYLRRGGSWSMYRRVRESGLTSRQMS